MKIIKKSRKLSNLNLQLHPEYLPNHSLFFDIETTGFSPAGSRLYLIGTAYLEGAELVAEQCFAESREEEPMLLKNFLNLIKNFNLFISFNGLGFDFPFLKGRYESLDINQADFMLNADYIQKNSIDLYKISSSYKHILQLENYKQKTLEKFLGIKREDKYDGGELIKIYQKYLKCPDEALLQTMLMHNYEDLLGLAGLLPLCALDDFFAGDFQITDCSCSDYRRMDGTAGHELTIHCCPKKPLPAAFSCSSECYYLHGSPSDAVLRIPFTEDTLKYFYPNFKDYYYLPEEDMAIHKSVAAYVEKAHRRKATAASCYTKKTGVFLPQYGTVFTPAFYKAYKAPVSYFEAPENQNWNMDQLKKYSIHILSVLKSG